MKIKIPIAPRGGVLDKSVGIFNVRNTLEENNRNITQSSQATGYFQQIKYLLPIIIGIVLFLQSCSSDFTVSYTGDYCEDGIVDRDETDVDCGGQYCDPCSEGYACEDDDDCDSENCIDNVCAEAEEDTPDTDGDSVYDTDDVCEGYNDTADADSDTVPDGCDLCDGEDDIVDVMGESGVADCLEELTTRTAMSCAETDDGIYTFGVTTVTYEDESGAETTVEYTDVCYIDYDDATVDTLVEYSCDGADIIETTYSCDCVDQTACAEAEDTTNI